ncbi:MAG: GtrA family protein [Chromatiaceae bacterium]|nr:GtrA family protein [Chromatiaceae bacterium]
MTTINLELLVRYIAAGTFAVAVHYLILILMVEGMTIDATLASACGFAFGVSVNYLLQYYWTFRSSGSHTRRFPLFGLVAVAMLGLNAAIFWGLHERAGVNYLIAQAVAIGVVFVFNFVINARYTFARIDASG